MKYFSTNIKRIRRDKKLTQAEIKANTGIEPSTWSNYERGKSFPNLKLFDEICKYFGVSADDLLNRDLSNVHLNENEKDKKSSKNVHLNVHPIVHLNASKEEVNTTGKQEKEPCARCANRDEIIKSKDKIIDALQELIDALKMSQNLLQQQLHIKKPHKKRAE